jgi:hypothetical protein
VAGAVEESRHRLTAADLRQAEEALTQAAIEMKRAEPLRDALVQAAREQIRRNLAAPAGAAQVIETDEIYSALARAGVDTVVEIGPTSLRLDRISTRETSYAVFVDAQVRLVRTRDRRLLYAEPMHYRSGTGLFVDWTANSAEPFRLQVQRGYEQIAQRLVSQLFLQAWSADEPESRRVAHQRKSEPRSRTVVATRREQRPASGIVEAVGPALTPSAVSQLGDVGIITTSTVPKLSLQSPLTQEDANDAALADADCWLDEMSAGGPMARLFGLATAIPASLGEQACAATQGLTERKYARASNALAKAIREINPQEGLRQSVLRQAQAQTQHPIRLVEKPFPADRKSEFEQMSCVMAGTLAWVPNGQTPEYYLRSQGIETALEIQLLNPALKQVQIHRSLALPPDANPPLAFSMDVRTTCLALARANRCIRSCSNIAVHRRNTRLGRRRMRSLSVKNWRAVIKR